MRISRLYLPRTLEEGAVLRLDEESAHYLRTVLRLKKGTDLTVFNGDGSEYSARVSDIVRDEVRLEIGDRRNREVESSLITHLGLGISRGERMDLAIQKAVELGVTRITPLFTEHCVVRLDEARRGNRHQHWQKVARSACEQCGRNRVPEVEEPAELEDWIAGREGLRLFFDPQGAVGLRDLPQPEGSVCLLSGPEGGFAATERALAREAGFTAVRLGPRILRTETAVLAALSAIQAIWGDLG
ncbi:16S rRNA (uracil(1498)-N(3))-methyltransferase [Methylocaldum sp.]|uniref:16S rRNA (uracil(1498)-N(3))-methyltransferase n=1 Tax=Methylocaldum sp. TaxID=1969727 RepID=UPI002D2A7F81|nr:16S rRNA (uracil(1498)-N(3))-methyltransferase [Methylocaldum sp.]HYE36710.1 16S rRNA (uracil(1498)-N(3))-methyltransferase [Methylocaldum sp.]